MHGRDRGDIHRLENHPLENGRSEPIICLEQVSKDSHQNAGHNSGTGDGNSRSSTLGRSAGSRQSGAGGVGRILARNGDLGVVVRLGVPGVGARVVVGGSMAGIGFLDNVQDAVASRALAVGQGDGPGGRVLGVLASRLRARVGLVQAQVGDVHIVVGIAGLIGDNLEDVGTTVPLGFLLVNLFHLMRSVFTHAAERGQTPISANGGNGRVVGVEGVVLGTLEVIGDSTTNEHAM